MADYDPKSVSTTELFSNYAEILEELITRKVIRTRNNPVADYSEWLVAKKLGLKLEGNSNPGFDAKDGDCKRYQIKARRLTRKNTSRQLGIIRDLEEKKFDYLIGILFDKSFGIEAAYQVPHHVVVEFGRPNSHQRGHILHLRGALLTAPGVDDITDTLRYSAAS